MLPGDIEAPVERALALRYGEELQSDIVLAPHHGSTSSSSYAFIKRLQPTFVVFPRATGIVSVILRKVSCPATLNLAQKH